MTFRSSSAISENSIVFFEGGHDHDGVSSSLIDTEQYSIYDFIVGKTGSNARQIRQQRNFDNLKTVVSNIVINDVLGPSGIRLLPNSVQSVHIAAGAITANELAANIVLVNNVISSNNYVPNTSGWVLYSNGTAEFGAASIRGTLTAGAVTINNNNYWYSNGVFRVGSNSEFMSFNGSDLSVTGDVTTGNLTATGGSIGGWQIGADLLSAANGDIALYADGNAGSLVAGTDANNQISLLSDGSLSAVASNIETTINVPYIFGGNQFTFIVKSVATPLNAVRISPSRVIASTTSNAITLDANDGINTNLGITAGGQIQGDTIYSDGTMYAGGTGVYYNTSNLPGSRFGMSFGWDAPIAAVSFIVDNNPAVDGWILPDGFYSDRRIKSNISPLANELLEKIYSIKTYEFDYNDSIPHESLRGKHDIGVIADELELLFPEIVINKDDPDKYKQVLYIKTIPLLLGVIGDLNTRLKALEQHLGYNS